MPEGERVLLRRPAKATASMIARATADPRYRRMMSKALRRPYFPREIYISKNFVHFQERPTSQFDKRGYRTKSTGERGTLMVVGCPRGTWDDVRNRCRTGTRVQGWRIPNHRVKRVLSLFYGRAIRFRENPLLMTVMNPGYRKNPVDVQYDPRDKMYRVYRTNPVSKALTFRPKKVEVSGPKGKYVRYRKASPRAFDKRSFRTIPVGRRGTKMVIGCPKGKWSSRTRRCKVGTRAQSVLVPKSRHRSRFRAVANPMDLALSTPMAIYDQNQESEVNSNQPFEDNPFSDNPPHDPYCDNPDHGHRVFSDNPMDIALSMAPGMFNDNPEFSIGDFVRNKQRVMIGNIIELEKGELGQIESVGKMMGKDVYSVKFYRPDGGSRLFKFFAYELEKEEMQLRGNYEENRFQPRTPLSHYTRRRHISGPTGVDALHRQPSSRDGNGRSNFRPMKTRRAKIPVAKFEAWLKVHGSPEEVRRYQKEKIAYKRFHKGADPVYITRRLVDVGAGKKIMGRAFGYSMGKSPFEPYITPTGSGKGNKKPYLHEYETMPEGITNSTGKVVIKPLEGRTRITDWIHH